MATGTVKWFNNAKGYGFVLAQESNEDLFIHYSSIQMDGYKSLKAGQQIEYDVQQGPKGMHAVNIRYAAGTCSAAAEQADNLHLNPMHDVPHPAATDSPAAAISDGDASGAENAPQEATVDAAPGSVREVEVEEG